MMKMRVILAGFATLMLASCAGVDEIVENQCPEIAVLATADSWQGDGVAAQMDTVRLTCFVDSKTDELLADIQLTGTTSKAGTELAFFVATLNDKDAVTHRLQYKVTAGSTSFSFDLPRYVYATRATLPGKPRLVAGFVLSEAQLVANRAAYRKRLGLD